MFIKIVGVLLVLLYALILIFMPPMREMALEMATVFIIDYVLFAVFWKAAS